jgi:V/A-type H+-transporting ATPase subunit I
MMFTTEMIQLFAIVLGRDSGRVTEVLLREGAMQFINKSEIEGRKLENLSTVSPQVSIKEITGLRGRIEGLLHTSGIIPATPKEADLNNYVPVDIEKEKNFLDQIDRERNGIRERQRAIQQEILKLEDIKRQVELYGLGLSDLPLKAKHSFLAVQTGKIPVSNAKRLEDELRGFPSLNVALGREDDTAYYLLISMKREKEQIGKILSSLGWTSIELPNELQFVKEDIFKDVSVKLETLTDEQRRLETNVKDLIKKHEERFRKAWVNLRITELFSTIQTNFKSSSRTVIFTGWLPASKKEKLAEKIQKSCEGRCYLQWYQPGEEETLDEEVPVEFNNPKLLAPFQMLVSNFGIPEYGTIDPTPFVMPLYLAMFGLMFADVGQGFVLAMLGVLGAFHFKANPEKRGMFTLSWLIIWCGLSSIIFGALFGSYFGVSLFKPIWFDFHGIVSGHIAENSAFHDIFDILMIAIYFGISVIFLGLVFNWINIIRTGKWAELIFDKGGILGGWIYGGGIYIAYYMIKHDYKEFPPGMVVFILAVLPAVLLFIKEPYHYFKHRTTQSFNPIVLLNFFMQWVIELLEIFSGYLSNTLSFMRVAGLGIAHVSLMIAFFTIANMTSGVMSIVILILGNMLVIGLEGLTAAVQALRLSYYEFFTKFFHGTGKLYTPISLNSSYK